MKVKDLITLLSTQNPEALVLVDVNEEHGIISSIFNLAEEKKGFLIRNIDKPKELAWAEEIGDNFYYPYCKGDQAHLLLKKDEPFIYLLAQ